MNKVNKWLEIPQTKTYFSYIDIYKQRISDYYTSTLITK